MQSSSSAQPDSERDQQLAILLAELTDRVQSGEQIDLNQVCRQHPDLADELRHLWGAVMVADAAATTSVSDNTANHFPADTLTLPLRFGDYELLEEIGQGGMGVVYRARQISLNREVAVKMILRGSFATKLDRERFQAEAEAAARLNHPNIVPVFEVGELGGRQYFSMEFVRGKTLLDWFTEGPVPPRDVARILELVARAIHYAHGEGVLHRDLKPSNILIDDLGRPRLTDFGLAKRADSTSLTRTGIVLGTPTYMSPEQAAGRQGRVGPASDVYSLGSILYHSLAGRPPFEAESPMDVVLKVLEQDPVPPRLINPKADRDLEVIAIRCLQKPADLRYETAAALADDLRAYLHDEPIAARSGRFAQVVAGWFRETHHAIVLENWGLLWMWHSLVLLIACVLTNTLHLYWPETSRWYYIALWTVGFGAWAAVFWMLRRRMGPVTFVERQIAHVWAASMISIALLFPFEWWLGLRVLTLAPILGLITGMVFMVKAGILSGAFYVQSAALFLTAPIMGLFPRYEHFIFGVVAAACFFFPGLKYYRQRRRRVP